MNYKDRKVYANTMNILSRQELAEQLVAIMDAYNKSKDYFSMQEYEQCYAYIEALGNFIYGEHDFGVAVEFARERNT